MKPPRAYARGIIHFFGGIRRSTLLRSPSFGGSTSHSSMGLRPWSSAKADKTARKGDGNEFREMR